MADVQDYKAGSSSSTAQAAAASAEEQRFQIAPAPQNMFQPTKVKALVEELLKAELADVAYDGSESTKLSTELANKIRAKLKELQLARYKLMVQVVLGENKGAGVRVGTRCLWDPNTDNLAQATYINDTLYCCAVVFGVYLY